LPAEAGIHDSANGAEVSVPTTAALPPDGVTRNCTWAIVAPLPAVAVAVSGTLDPAVITDPTAGAVRETEGCELTTETATAVEFAVWVVESVTVAVSENAPAEGGVQATVYGGVSTVPMGAPFAEKATLVTVAPGLGTALAVTVTGVPTVPELLLAGADRETVGAETTVTEIAAEVTEDPLESKIRAVRETFPVVVGVHEIEHGAAVTVPMIVDPPRRNCTWEMVAPVPAVAVAETVVAVFTVTVAPADGAEIDTEG